MTGEADPRIKGVLQKFEEIDAEHKSMQRIWRDASAHAYRRADFDGQSPGQRRDLESYDDTAMHANWQATAQIQGALMPRGAAWFTLHDLDEGFNLPRAERIWFQESTDTLHALFAAPQRSLYMSAHEALLQNTALGNGPLFLGEDGEGPWFKSLPLSQCRLGENEKGHVDTIGRNWKATPARIVQAYGAEAAGEKIRALADRNDTTKLELIHLVDPRPGGSEGGFARNKPFRSITICKDHNHVIAESGFDALPFAWPRWSKRAGEQYGWGVATEYLGDIKGLNELAMRFLQAVQLIAAPPMMLPGEGLLNEFSLAPFAFNYFDPLKFGLQMPQAVELGGRTLPVTDRILEQARFTIKTRFAVDWLEAATDRQTRVQFLTNRDDRLALQAPALDRSTGELLGPVIAHAFRVCVARRMFTRPPASLAERMLAKRLNLHVGYQSPLTRLQRYGELDAIVATTQYAAEVAQFDPTARFVIDTMAAIEGVAQRSGAPAAMIRAREDIAAMIEAANKQAEQAQQAQAMQQGAAAVRDVAHAASMARGPGTASPPKQQAAA